MQSDGGRKGMFSRVMAAGVGATGLVVLAGWQLDVEVLTGVGPVVAPPLAALALIASAAALWLLAPVSPLANYRIAGRTAASVAGLIGLVTLAEHSFVVNLGSGQWLYDAERMPVVTALLLVGSAIAFWCLDPGGGPRARVSGWFAIAMFTTSYVVLLSYLYGATSAIHSMPRGMSLYSAISFMMLSLGLVFARPDCSLATKLTSTSVGGVMARRLLPAALALPALLGWLLTFGEQLGWYDALTNRALLVSAIVAAFAVLIWRNIASLDAIEEARTRAAYELRQGQELLKAIVDNSQAVIYVKDLAGRYLLVNRRFEEFFKLRQDQIVGFTDHDLFPREWADRYRAMDIRAAAAGHAIVEEEEVPVAQGNHTYLSIKAPLRDPIGDAYAIFGISTDITDRKRVDGERAELLSRESAAREDAEALYGVARALTSKLGLKDIVQIATDSATRLTGAQFGAFFYNVADPKGESYLLFTLSGAPRESFEKFGLPRNTALFDHTFRGQGAVRLADVREDARFGKNAPHFGLPAGHPPVVSYLAIPVLGRAGDVIGGLFFGHVNAGVFSERSERIASAIAAQAAIAIDNARLYEQATQSLEHQGRLNSALQAAYDEIRQTQQAVLQHERLRALGQMASGIAHDINNAISPAALYVESVLEREQGLSARAREHLNTVQQAIHDVAQTVSRLREFYRPREAQLPFEPIDVNLVVHQVCDLTRARWSDIPQQRGIVIHLDTELAQRLPTIMGAAAELRDALTNLIFNAVDAMPTGGTLTITTREAAGMVDIEVRDTGIGMDEETRRRCIEPFFTTKGQRGTGLGLATVYGMLERHAGVLEIESVPSNGTSVRLRFPVPRPESVTTTERQLPVRPEPGLRILLIDDDPLILASLGDVLEHDGHHLSRADGGQAGIDAFSVANASRKPFDIVITDLGMPHVDGRAVAAALRRLSPGTPIIMLTGWGQRLIDDDDLPEHVDHVLAKPPRTEELRRALAALTALRRAG
jgi:PAS domain S-box-containing protein